MQKHRCVRSCLDLYKFVNEPLKEGMPKSPSALQRIMGSTAAPATCAFSFAARSHTRHRWLRACNYGRDNHLHRSSPSGLHLCRLRPFYMHVLCDKAVPKPARIAPLITIHRQKVLESMQLGRQLQAGALLAASRMGAALGCALKYAIAQPCHHLRRRVNRERHQLRPSSYCA